MSCTLVLAAAIGTPVGVEIEEIALKVAAHNRPVRGEFGGVLRCYVELDRGRPRKAPNGLAASRKATEEATWLIQVMGLPRMR